MGKKWDELKDVTPEEALKHPNWQMGKKITIDSATMMNKGLEIIEACHLFGVKLSQIEVLIHPQSIVHSMVRFKDGSFLAQMGVADMKMPIASCLFWPEMAANVVGPLNFTAGLNLTFTQAKMSDFPCLALAREALALGTQQCVVLNAANEVAVELFLAGKIPFTAIPKLIAYGLETYAKHEQDFDTFDEGASVGSDVPNLLKFVADNFQIIEHIDQETRRWVRDAHGEF